MALCKSCQVGELGQSRAPTWCCCQGLGSPPGSSVLPRLVPVPGSPAVEASSHLTELPVGAGGVCWDPGRKLHSAGLPLNKPMDGALPCTRGKNTLSPGRKGKSLRTALGALVEVGARAAPQPPPGALLSLPHCLAGKLGAKHPEAFQEVTRGAAPAAERCAALPWAVAPAL